MQLFTQYLQNTTLLLTINQAWQEACERALDVRVRLAKGEEGQVDERDLAVRLAQGSDGSS